MSCNKLQILGLSSNFELAKKKVSCTNSFLYDHLVDKRAVYKILHIKLSRIKNLMLLANNFSFNKSLWLFRDRISIKKAKLKSEIVDKASSNLDFGKFNACLQIGSDFSIMNSQAFSNKAKFSYHDNNILAFLKSKHMLPVELLQKEINKIVDFEKNIYKSIDCIFTMTDYLKNSFQNDFQIPPNKVFNIGVGTNLSTPNYIEKKFESNNIVFVAKDSFKEKGGYDLINAFRIVKKMIPNSKLIIVGCKISTDEPGVIFTGFINKANKNGENRLIDIYRNAAVFAMPSYVEATGNVFLEAMACKLPCVGGNLSAMPELLVNNNCGFVAEVGNVEDIASKIIAILNNKNLQREFSENGFKAIKEKYNWDIVCDKALNIIRSVL